MGTMRNCATRSGRCRFRPPVTSCLTACERGQLAQEAAGHGVFTTTLGDVLRKSGDGLSYADLFVRCRAAVRSRAFDQDPQFETYGGFDAYAGFLAGSVARASRRRYFTYCDQGAWTAECGAINGVSSEPGASVTLALYSEDDATTPVGTARAVQVGPQKSEIELDFESAESARYIAEITSLPAAPMPRGLRGGRTVARGGAGRSGPRRSARQPGRGVATLPATH